MYGKGMRVLGAWSKGACQTQQWKMDEVVFKFCLAFPYGGGQLWLIPSSQKQPRPPGVGR